MSRERWGLVAFLVLAAGSLALPLLVRDEARVREAPCPGADVPIYPGARPIRTPAGAGRLLEAVGDLGLTTALEQVEAYVVPAEVWLGPESTGGDVFGFYVDSMAPVWFERMGPELRGLLGLPETGSVDSPPLLYTADGGALVIEPARDGSLTLLVMCEG